MTMIVRLDTSQKIEVINVTALIAPIAEPIQEGIAVIHVPHTTAALLVCEDDADLRDDLVRVVDNLFAPLRPFKHSRNNNPNAEAHLFSAIAGASISLAVAQGQLQLGTYQNLLFVEMDGPKTREIRCIGVRAALV